MSDHHDPGMPMASRHGPEHALERLIFFSDAVFAIAITLLVIELHVPHVDIHAGDDVFLQALADMSPNFLGFAISFFVIGAFWNAHHRAFGCAAHWDERLRFANLLMLFAIVAMPFFTALVSEYGKNRVPVLVYCGWLLLTALLNNRLVRLATSPPVVDPTVPAEVIGRIRRRSIASALGAATAIIVGLLATQPVFAQMSLVSIMVWRRLLDWQVQRVGTGSAPE
jgi:uncharacterized membrane protein